MSTKDLDRAVVELVQNGNILESDAPAPILAEKLLHEADPVVIAELGQSLMITHFARLIRAERRKGALQRHEQFTLFEHLPLRIWISENKRVKLEAATYTALRQYHRFLNRHHRNRKREDPKLAETKALMERVRKANQRGITVGEVLGLSG
jgi:hypothetical protein